ncbi:MAG: hypothetical protein Q8N53_11195, partial [Longimicrobiales bacterium]|nr:hypothetical protein [Longimicrobiales bacterium]
MRIHLPRHGGKIGRPAAYLDLVCVQVRSPIHASTTLTRLRLPMSNRLPVACLLVLGMASTPLGAQEPDS